MLSYDEALLSVIETVQPLPPCGISTVDAAGLMLADSVKARWDMPSSNNSAMDGFAISGCSTVPGSPVEIIGAAYAGHLFPGTISKGQSTRITTGATLPHGADTVIPIEDAKEECGQLHIQTSFTVGQHVRLQGKEFQAGEELLQKGTLLQAGEISLLASAGVAQVKVYPRPRVAIISTGDELIELGESPEPGQIINSNIHFLATRLLECGCEAISLGISKDDTASLDQCISQALNADLVLTTGGVSVGERDQVQAAFSRHNFQKHFWKVAIKPGKPVLFGFLEGKPFFGLPGNPAATAATFEIFVRPALKKMAGYKDCQLPRRSGILTKEIKCEGMRQSFLWCQLKWCSDQYEVNVRSHQGSGQNRTIQGANALLAIPAGTKYTQGERVEVLLLD